ncbi:hypothetical protein PENSPDRAFT_757900 [Peniophora sp. CONT]|nr:hypothetical protein PENSPDRAFT_757900 [Peniophora sp. CONT]
MSRLTGLCIERYKPGLPPNPVFKQFFFPSFCAGAPFILLCLSNMSVSASARRQLQPVVLDSAGDVTLPVNVKDQGTATPPTFALEPPAELPLSVPDTVSEATTTTSSSSETSTGVSATSSSISTSNLLLSPISSSTVSSTSSIATSSPITPSTSVIVVVTSSWPSASSTATAIASTAPTSHSDSLYVGIALAVTGGVAAVLLLLAWWTRVRARSRRRWELASRSSSTTNFDLLWQPSRDRDAGEPKRDLSLHLDLQAPSAAVVREKAGAFDLVNIPKPRARPTLPLELQPSESSLQGLGLSTNSRPVAIIERPLAEAPQDLNTTSPDLASPGEGPDDVKSRYASLQCNTQAGLDSHRSPSSVASSPEVSVGLRPMPASGNNTWRERLQARRPLPEQPPFDAALGESWLDSIRRRVFVGQGVHVPQNSTDFGLAPDAAAEPMPTYTSHFVTSPAPHPSGPPHPRPRGPPGLQ